MQRAFKETLRLKPQLLFSDARTNGPGDPFHFFRLIATRLEWGLQPLRTKHRACRQRLKPPLQPGAPASETLTSFATFSETLRLKPQPLSATLERSKVDSALAESWTHSPHRERAWRPVPLFPTHRHKAGVGAPASETLTSFATFSEILRLKPQPLFSDARTFQSGFGFSRILDAFAPWKTGLETRSTFSDSSPQGWSGGAPASETLTSFATSPTPPPPNRGL